MSYVTSVGSNKYKPVKKSKKIKIAPRKSNFTKHLEEIIDVVYQCADEKYKWDWGVLAEKAGLSYSCIYRLGYYQTREPRYSTIWKLCRAVKFDLGIVQEYLNKKAV